MKQNKNKLKITSDAKSFNLHENSKSKRVVKLN